MILMKYCPQCSAEYNDNVTFCPKDGRTLLSRTATNARLCPQCANSIAADVRQCPYCKANVGSAPTPQWPGRAGEPPQRDPARRQRISPVSRAILIVGIAAFVSTAFLLVARRQRSDSLNTAPSDGREQEKTVQERDHKIQALQTELNRVRQQLTERSEQLTELNARHEQLQRDSAAAQQRLTELKAKYDQSQRDLAVTQERLAIANRHTERLASSRVEPAAPPPARAPDVQRPAPPVPPPPPPPPAPAVPPPAPPPPRRAAEPGTYETVRATTVYEEPSGSSRVLSQISRGTRVAVVRSVGDWLEVRSKHGNPPGYIRIDDAMFVSRAN
jgi:hypothetical protein